MSSYLKNFPFTYKYIDVNITLYYCSMNPGDLIFNIHTQFHHLHIYPPYLSSNHHHFSPVLHVQAHNFRYIIHKQRILKHLKYSVLQELKI